MKRKAVDEQSAVTTEAKLEAEDATTVKAAMAASMGAENSERMKETLAAAATLEKKRAKEAKEAEERAKLPPEEQKAKEGQYDRDNSKERLRITSRFAFFFGRACFL